MNKQQEALKLALEALEETLRTLDDENAKPGGAISDTIWYSEHETLFDYIAAQITVIREALAEQPAQQQEPVALDVTIEGDSAKLLAAMLEPVLDEEPIPIRLLVGNGHSGHGLYVAAAEYQDEGAALLVNTSPPASKPLTDEQWQVIADTLGCFITRSQKDTIEYALGIKEKNHG